MLSVQNMNRILKPKKKAWGAVRGRDASIFAIKKHPLDGSQLINFCHQTPGRRFVFDLKNSNLGFFNSLLLFFFNPEVPAPLGEPTPESPSARNASGTESPARRRAAHASLRAVGAAAPGVEGLRKGRPRRFRCWKPRQRRMSGVQGGWKKPRFEAEDVWRNAVDWVQLCGFFMFLWVVGMVF